MEPIALPVLAPQYRLGTHQGATIRGGAPTLQRILYRLQRAGVDITDGDACWPWSGSVDRGGYGRLVAPDGETLVHRIMFRECVGPIPAGHEVDHVCHSRDLACRDGSACMHRRCCNPRHLDPVTHAENLRRRRTEERGMPCANAPHEFVSKPGRDGCKTCFNAYHWAYMRRGFRGTYAELWASPVAAEYMAARRVR